MNAHPADRRRMLILTVIVPCAMQLAACAGPQVSVKDPDPGRSGNRTALHGEGRWNSGDAPHAAGERVPVPAGSVARVPDRECIDAQVASAPAEAPQDEDFAPDSVRQAEDAYREERFTEALALFCRSAMARSRDPAIWLRIGNIHHRGGEWLAALRAYGQAAHLSAPDDDPVDPLLRAKALYNRALVGLELARSGIAALRLARLPSPALAGERDTLAAALERQVDQAANPLEKLSPRDRAGDDEGARSGDGGPAAAGRHPSVGGPSRVEYFRGEPQSAAVAPSVSPRVAAERKD